MNRAYYPLKNLWADYARSGIGVLLLGVPMSFADLPTYLSIFFWAVIGIFLLYGARTFNRQMTVFEYDDDRIHTRGGYGGAIDWKDLELVNLRYFSTRRDNRDGWLHLQLAGGGQKLRLDTGLEGFNDIAILAYNKATARGLSLNTHTIANFASMGMGETDPDPIEPEASSP